MSGPPGPMALGSSQDLPPAVSGSIAAGGFLVLAQLPLGPGWIPGVAALVAALLDRRLAAPLCIAACMVQDAPGLTMGGHRIAVCGCAAIHAFSGGFRHLREATRLLRLPVILCLLAVVIGTAVSILGSLGFGPEQSSLRPFPAVALGDVIMILGGAMLGASCALDPSTARRAAGAAVIGLAFIVIRVAMQRVLGVTAGFSEAGVAAILAADQLKGTTSTGVVRYVGPTLTPNAMSLAFSFATLLAWPMLGRLGILPRLLVGISTVVMAVLAGSKSSLLVSLVILVVLPGPLVGIAAAGTFAAWLAWDPAFRDLIGLRLRLQILLSPEALALLRRGAEIEAAGLGGVLDPQAVRGGLWRHCAAHLSWSGAVFGLGLSHWPVFFQKTIGKYAADPHSSVFSYLWTYGIAGAAALVSTVLVLARVAWRSPHCRPIALVGLAVLLGRDLVSIPLLIGPTFLTFLLWTLIAQAVILGAVTAAREETR